MEIQRKCLDAMLYSVTQHCVMCIQGTCNCKYMYKVIRGIASLCAVFLFFVNVVPLVRLERVPAT